MSTNEIASHIDISHGKDSSAQPDNDWQMLPIHLTKEWMKEFQNARVLFEKLLFHLVQKFPTISGTLGFITVFTADPPFCLYWVKFIQPTSSHPIWLRSVSILSSHLRLGLQSGPFPLGFPTKTQYAFVFYPNRATYTVHMNCPLRHHLYSQLR